MKKKPIIAVDIDDVLSFTAKGWVEYSNKTWGLNLTPDEYDEDWVKVWNIEYAEALKRRDVVFKSGIHGQYEQNKQAKSVLTRLAGKYRLIIVTSRLEIVRSDTLEWLNRHFKGVFDEVRFSGFYDKDYHSENYQESVNQTKAGLLKQIGADYLIDDQPKHCLAAAKIGVKALLFGDYPWNRLDTLPSGVIRVHDWSDVARYFDAQG